MLRKQRNLIPVVQQMRAADDVAAHVESLLVFQQSEKIALYSARDGELDPKIILKRSLASGKRCYLPIVIRDSGKNTLQFAEVAVGTRLQSNVFGIPEPATSPEQRVSADQLDLVFLPLVGFDRYGNRIGMGGGFYDTTFAFKKSEPQRLPHLLGLAHESQCVEKVESEDWDIPISAVVTDRRIYRCAELLDDH